MRPLRQPVAVAVGACALLATLGGCTKRPLPEQEGSPGGIGGGGDTGNAGTGGGGGTSCSAANPRLDLVGAPLLVLDRPAGTGNLYTSLLWTGDEYLFFWRVFNGDGVFMQRIDASGRGVGGNIRVRGYENAFDIAWSGDRLAAAWTRQSAGANIDLMFQTFDRLGRPLIDAVTARSSPVIATDGSVVYGPRIAPIAGAFAIAWNEGQVRVATVDPDGHLQHGPIVVGGGEISSATHLSLAAAHDRVLVGWNGAPTPPPTTPSPTEVSTVTRAFSGELIPLGDGVVLDGDAFFSLQQVLATGSGFLALWTHGLPLGAAIPTAAVYIAQLDGAGMLVAEATMAPPVAGYYREVAPAVWNDDHLVVLWDGTTTGTGHLTLSRFGPDGVRQGDSINLPTMAPASRLHVAAHDRTVGFVWSEEIAGAYEVYFQQATACP